MCAQIPARHSSWVKTGAHKYREVSPGTVTACIVGGRCHYIHYGSRSQYTSLRKTAPETRIFTVVSPHCLATISNLIRLALFLLNEHFLSHGCGLGTVPRTEDPKNKRVSDHSFLSGDLPAPHNPGRLHPGLCRSRGHLRPPGLCVSHPVPLLKPLPPGWIRCGFTARRDVHLGI